MAYKRTFWRNNKPPYLDADNLNNIEDGIEEALSGTLEEVSSHIIPTEDEVYDLGSPTLKFRDLYLSGNTMYLGNAQISATNEGALNLPADSRVNGAQIPPTNLEVEPEVLAINVNAEGHGQNIPWLWTWGTSSLAYSRINIENQFQPSVPLYENGVYTINNFAMGGGHSGLSQGHGIHFKWIEGAGTENLVPWKTDQGMQSVSHPAINNGDATMAHTQLIQVPSFDQLNVPSQLNPPNVSYTVSVNGGFEFSGSADGVHPTLGPWYRGGTYTFEIDTEGHPLYLTTDNGANFQMGTYFGEYTDGVTNPRTSQGVMTITVPEDAPDNLFYQCANHSGMRGSIVIKDLEVKRNSNGNVVIFAQHGQEGMVTPIELRPLPSLTTQMCIVYDKDIQRFVPQDLSTYLERTPSFAQKIREIAGTATLTVAEGSPVVSTVRVIEDASYLPYTGNNVGDLAYDKTGNAIYVWEGTDWEGVSGASGSGDTTVIGGGDFSYWKVQDGAPSVSEDPPAIGVFYWDSAQNYPWICRDNTPGANVWANLLNTPPLDPDLPELKVTHGTSFSYSPTAADADGAAVGFIIDQISNAVITVEQSEIAAGESFVFTAGMLTEGEDFRQVNARIRTIDDAGQLSEGAILLITVESIPPSGYLVFGGYSNHGNHPADWWNSPTYDNELYGYLWNDTQALDPWINTYFYENSPGNQYPADGEVNYFDVNRQYRFGASKGCWSGDTAYVTITFATESGTPIFSLETRYRSTFSLNLYYRNGAGSWVQAPGHTGSNPNPVGHLKFDEVNNTVHWINVKSSDTVNDFSVPNVSNIGNIAKIMVSGADLDSNWSGGCTARFYLRLMAPEDEV